MQARSSGKDHRKSEELLLPEGDNVYRILIQDPESKAATRTDSTGKGTVLVASKTGLDLPHDMPLGSWERLGRQICDVANSSAWWIGDWLIFGEARYPDRYRRVISQTALGYQTLRNYAWVARRFEPDRRRRNLSFAHHVEVAALNPDDQDHWLDLAENLAWSRNTLRSQLRASANGKDAAASALGVKIHLEVKVERVASWERAAALREADLNTWMADVLDAAARSTGPSGKAGISAGPAEHRRRRASPAGG